MHLPLSFICYVYSFGSYRVDKHKNAQTNIKQTPLKTSNALRCATTLGKSSNVTFQAVFAMTILWQKLFFQSTNHY